MNRKLSLCASLALVSLIGIGVSPTDAAAATTRTRAKTPAKSTRTLAKPTAKSTRTTLSARKTRPTAYSAARSLSRKQTLARARAAAMAREVADTALPRFKVDSSGDLVPDLRAAAAIVYNPATNEVLWEENSQDQRSIASITKVMTATVFLESNPDISEPVTVSRADVTRASTTFLHANDKVTVDDLLHLLLIASDNAAARALARVSPYGSEGFIARMNSKAAELGLQSAHYSDPSGLLSDNMASAYDMARLITFASKDPRISGVMQKQEYTATAGRRTINIHSTNQLVRQGDVDVRAGKTGFITKAGYCLATLLRLPQGGPQVAVVVLGAKSNAGRFWETRHLFNWLSTKAQDLLGAGGASTEAAAATN